MANSSRGLRADAAEVLFMVAEAAFSEGVQNRVYCYRPFTAVKHLFYWALKSPLRKSEFLGI
jgi:hypothetical protein